MITEDGIIINERYIIERHCLVGLSHSTFVSNGALIDSYAYLDMIIEMLMHTQQRGGLGGYTLATTREPERIRNKSKNERHDQMKNDGQEFPPTES